MLHRHHCLLVALLLPFLALLGGNGATGFASETQVNSSVSGALRFAGLPLDRGHAFANDASESADEEGPPKKFFRANCCIVIWTREFLTGSAREIAPSYVGEAPIVHAARPRAPPTIR